MGRRTATQTVYGAAMDSDTTPPVIALQPLPDTFMETRLALHRLASLVISPARRQAMGRMGLRQTPGGFGTPVFDGPNGPTQIRLVASNASVSIEVDEAGETRAAPVTTLNEAGAFVGLSPDIEWAADLDIPAPGPLDEQLPIDPAAAVALADWYAFGWSILEELRDEPTSPDASDPQLWPEHFDPAIELGTEEAKQRASYGFSAGDVTKEATPGAEALPYAYVGPWFPDARPDSDFWNAAGFPGALIRHAEIVAAGDADAQRALVLSFCRNGRDLLVGES